MIASSEVFNPTPGGLYQTCFSLWFSSDPEGLD